MAGTNTREWVLGIEKWMDETEDVRKLRTKAVAMRALRGVVLSTRVDTGRARANWQVAEGRPPRGSDMTIGAPGGRQAPEIQSRVDAVAAGGRVIEQASGEEVVWLHNGLPYIEQLEAWDKMVVGTYEALRTWLRS